MQVKKGLPTKMSIRVPASQIAQLRAVAAREDQSIAQLIRRFVRTGLAASGYPPRLDEPEVPA